MYNTPTLYFIILFHRISLMKRFLLSLLICGLTMAVGSAQLLWRVTGNGIERPSFIFGTHHVAPVSVLDSVTGFGEALSAADVVYGEMDMRSAMTPSAQQILIRAQMAPADSTLSRLLSPAQLDSVGHALQALMGPMMSVDRFDMVKPMALNTMIAVMQAQRDFPQFNPTQQLDAVIQQRALAEGKRVEGLETVEQQASLLFGAPLVDQASDLMYTVRHLDEAESFSARLAKAYLDGDLTEMLRLMEDPAMGVADGSSHLIGDRNISWIRVLAGLLPSASVLIAVGAGHLPGDKGLLNLFRKEGYTVEPVK